MTFTPPVDLGVILWTKISYGVTAHFRFVRVSGTPKNLQFILILESIQVILRYSYFITVKLKLIILLKTFSNNLSYLYLRIFSSKMMARANHKPDYMSPAPSVWLIRYAYDEYSDIEKISSVSIDFCCQGD